MALGDHSVFTHCVAAVCQQLGANDENDEEGTLMVNRLIAANHKHKQGSQSRPPVQSPRAQSMFSQHACVCHLPRS